MAINEKLIVQEAAAGVDADPNIMLDLNAGDVDSYDGDGDVWYDIHDFEFKPTTNVSEHFNTVLYTGDGNTTAQPVTGVGFTPDLVWIKTRNQAVRHILTDSVRGVDSQIFSSENSTESNYGEFNTFDSDGFTVKRNTGTDYLNQSGINYVAWCFKAGGVPTATNTATSGAMTANSVSIDGTLESSYTPSGSPDIYPDKMSINTDLGFSVIQYGGSGAQETLPHGLGQNPELMIFKRTNTAAAWLVSDGTSMGYLNLTDSFSTTRHNQYINSVDANTIELNNIAGINGSSDEMIAYCFASKRGVSKVGSYIGTSAAGNKVYTGFEPAFVMLKNTSLSNTRWIIMDNVRDPENPAYKVLSPNSTAAEDTSQSYWLLDWDIDGFTLQYGGDNEFNRNGDTFIYLAFAKDTNETSLHNTDLELNLEADSYSGSGNWLDSSGNGNNGTITGATWEQELGNFFDLDGSGDYIDAPTSGVLSGDFTVEMWWNFDTLSPPSGSAYRMLLGSSGYQVGSGLGHYIENNRLRTWVSVSGSTSNVVNGSGTDLTTNKWQHVVLTRSGGTYTQYIDTNQVGQASGTTASLDGTNSRIGGHYTQNGHDINAKVGQVRLYSTALSQAQIRQNYNFTKPKYPNEFHGDIIGTPSWNTEGSFNISGGNYINLGSDKAINFTTNSSISVWVNSSNSTGSKGILGRFNNTSPYGYILYQSSGNVGFSLYDSSGNGSFTGTTTLTNSTWTHFVVTYDGSNLILYKNGTSVSNVASTRIPSTPSANTLIGRYYSNVNVTTYDFAGKISKVKFYNTAITQSEVDALYNEGE